jgi:hypothetical protein
LCAGAAAEARPREAHIRLDLSRERPDSRAMSSADPQLLADTILSLVRQRGPDKTICPSEAARAVGGPAPDGWGPLMQPIRRVAVALAKEGRLVILRKGRIVDPEDFKGVYRLAVPREE